MSVHVERDQRSFRKSERCDSSTCVEVMVSADAAKMRESASPDGARLEFVATDWRAFIAAVKSGTFDH